MADKNKILKVAGVALAAVGALVYSALKAAVSSEDYDDDNAKKYKVIYNGDEEDEEFDSYEQAREYGEYIASCAREGAEILHMSNPGDYDEDDYCDDYEIIEK